MSFNETKQRALTDAEMTRKGQEEYNNKMQQKFARDQFIRSGGEIDHPDEKFYRDSDKWEILEDEIEEAISDSIDMDWRPRWGAKAVVELLKKRGAA